MNRLQALIAVTAAALTLLALPVSAQTVLWENKDAGKDSNAELKKMFSTAPASTGVVVTNLGSDPHLAHGWNRDTSHTECGGLRSDGKPQPSCQPKPANYMGPALGQCPQGTHFDLGTWSCWSCDNSKGFNPTGLPFTSDRACSRQATEAEKRDKPRYAQAIFLGRLCPRGDDMVKDGFYDSIRGGECWACPNGYNVNVLPHVEAENKCIRPAVEKFSFAELSFRTGDARHCVNRADGADEGQLVFWDGWHYWDKGVDKGPGCWKCPKGGYERTLEPVYSNKACRSVITADLKPATLRGIGKCEAGALLDHRNGGECWRCPAGYDRIHHNLIDSAQACETTTTLVFSKAKFEDALTCPADQTFDFIKVNDADLSRLKQAGRAAQNVAAAPNGGTCWKCPPEHKRTFKAVTDGEACEGETTEWYSKPYAEPGLFGLDGAEEVVSEILTYDRHLINETIREMVRQCAASNGPDGEICRTQPNSEFAKAWKEIATAPGESGVLLAMVFSRIRLAAIQGAITFAEDTRAVTAADQRLKTSFADYLLKRRLYVAEEALKAFDAWQKAGNAKRDQNVKATKGTVLIEQVQPPPDWNQMIQDAMLGTVTGAGGAAVSVMAAVAINPKLNHKIFPSNAIRAGFKQGGEKTGAKLGQKIAQKVGPKVGEKMLESAGKTAAGVLRFVKAAGPGFALTAVVTVIVEVALNADEYSKTDRPHILAMIANAKQPVDIRRDFLTDEREDLANGYWMMAVSGKIQPSPAAAASYKAVAESMMPATHWTQLPGAAVDAGAGGNALWVVGANPVPGGFGLHRWEDKTKKFVPMSGGALRIDVGQDGNPWVVNNDGQIFRWTGSAWNVWPGENARDIGVGGGEVWYIGGPKVAGGYTVYRWNPAKNTWTDGRRGGMRIDVDANGRGWMVNDTGQVFFAGSSGWTEIRGLGVPAGDIGVGPDGSVFVTGANDGAVYRYDRETSTWTKRDGKFTSITVGPNGVPVGVNQAQQIWLGYP